MSCNNSAHGEISQYKGMFQSLSGFPMSCNILLIIWLNKLDVVSIPIGFSNELQLEQRDIRARKRVMVSIPIGFSNELQP